MEEKYAGLIQTPEDWLMTTSRTIYRAVDLPVGPVRDAILGEAKHRGILVRLGPSSMDTAHAYAAALRVIGIEEADADETLAGLKPMTRRGQDFVNNAGEFAPREGEEP